MSRNGTFDTERLASINQRIREMFDFARDVIGDPAILEEIPDGAEIDSRSVAVGERPYRVVAYRSGNDPDRWFAIVTGRTNGDSTLERIDPITIRRQRGVCAEAAMDAAESALQATAQRGPFAFLIG